MILQKLIFQGQLENTDELYYKVLSGQVDKINGGILVQNQAVVDLMTYFNSFSAQKWLKYTKVSKIYVTLSFLGTFLLKIENYTMRGGKLEKKCIIEQQLSSKEKKEFRLDEFELPAKGLLGIQLLSKSDDSILYGGYYGTEQQLQKSEVQLGIGICTFKREVYIKRNMELLKREILNNEEALCYGKVSVCISDNAGTLDVQDFNCKMVRVVANKNLGGVGGFTRTILEHTENNKNITHVLLMDDDVIILPEVIERTYTFLTLLKQQYCDYVLGGALMRLDMPCIQYESGALWNDGDMIAHHHDFDMREKYKCVLNENEEHSDYVGWWYSCIPVQFIQNNGLPLPLFIHRDDIEYGLRAQGRFITMNGICVWHEAFENKLPGVTEYYDIRNLAIINAIHEPEYSAKNFKRMLLKQVSSNVGKYRYQYVDLNLLGAVDFLRGFRWFYNQDTLEIHRKLAGYNYKLVEKEEFENYKGIEAAELDFYGENNGENVRPVVWIRLWKMATLNGHILPAKKGKPKIAIPYPNIYDLYRCKEVIYVDSMGKALHVERSMKKLLESYVKLWRVCRMVDKYYDKACKEYRFKFRTLTNKQYWKSYLTIEK